jgi:hypothetical protein
MIKFNHYLFILLDKLTHQCAILTYYPNSMGLIKLTCIFIHYALTCNPIGNIVATMYANVFNSFYFPVLYPLL